MCSVLPIAGRDRAKLTPITLNNPTLSKSGSLRVVTGNLSREFPSTARAEGLSGGSLPLTQCA